MRLRKLDLIRYGKFADTTLDFGAGGRGSDVTVVYGDNEAGKSTAFTAWLDLLFGMPDRSPPYAFRFDRKDLLVGAEIETPDGPLTLRRTGAQKAPLTDAAGRSIADHRITALLHGLDRAAYRTRFSLDETILREGGEEIARAQGDLGRLLHAGTSGLSGVSEALDAIGADIDAFHKKGGRKTDLATAKRRLAEFDAALAEARLDPRRFDALRAAQTQAQAELESRRTAHDSAQRAVRLRDAADKRRDIAIRMQELDGRLSTLPDGPDLPEDAVARVTAAQERRQAAQSAKARAEETLCGAEDALAELTPDAAGLDVAARLESLEAATFDDGTSLLTRAQGAEADLSDVRAQRDSLEAQAKALARRIGGTACTPQELLLPRATLDRLQEVAGALRDADRALAQMTEARQEAEADLGPVVAVPKGLEPLADALTACERDTSEPQARADEARDLAAEADRAAAGLPETWRALAEKGLPEEATLTDLITGIDRAEEARKAARTRWQEETESQAETQAEHDALLGRGDSVTDTDIADSRAARDAAWAQHRATLDTPGAQAFETAMRRDDQLRDRHAISADTRLRLATLKEHLARTAHRLDRRRATVEESEAEVRRCADALANAAGTLGLPKDAPPEALRPRRTAMVTALDRALAAEAAQRRAAEAEERHRALHDRLSAAIAAAGETPDQQRLLPQAARLRDRLTAQNQAALSRDAAARSLDKLGARLARGLADQAKSRADFERETRELWCAGQEAGTLLSQLRDIDDLSDLDRRRSDLHHRVQRMEAALTAFENATKGMRAALNFGPETPVASVTDLLVAARRRAKMAEDRADRIDRLKATVAAAQDDAARADEDIVRCTAEIDAVLEGQTGTEADPPGQLVKLLDKRDQARAERDRLRQEHHRIGAAFDTAALTGEEARTDPARPDRLRAEAVEAEGARDDALKRLGEANEALRLALKGAGGADLDQQRATLLETLRDKARIAAAQMLGLMAAHHALRNFRQDRRGAMLEATERAFARLTHGEWPRLDTEAAGKTERLVALSDDQRVTAEAMSTGTRGQLYLALRIAGHADFVARHGALPFVTDDILETFDDRRAGAALELTAEMGKLGQAILFTHHRHLVVLARDTLPDVQVIDLT